MVTYIFAGVTKSDVGHASPPPLSIEIDDHYTTHARHRSICMQRRKVKTTKKKTNKTRNNQKWLGACTEGGRIRIQTQYLRLALKKNIDKN